MVLIYVWEQSIGLEPSVVARTGGDIENLQVLVFLEYWLFLVRVKGGEGNYLNFKKKRNRSIVQRGGK